MNATQRGKKDLLLMLLKESVNKFYEEQEDLFTRTGMEQTCVGHIYFYMQTLLKNDDRFVDFKALHLDIEYGKNGDFPKWIDSKKKRPDIILHRRANLSMNYKGNDKNTMVLEFKTRFATDENIKKDEKKLCGFTYPNQNNEYPYKYFLGVLIQLEKENPQYTFFQNGAKIPEINLLEWELWKKGTSCKQ